MGKRFTITESEKNEIRKKYNLINEGEGFFGRFDKLIIANPMWRE